MAKSDKPLEYIKTRRAKNPLRKPEWVGDKEIVAFDTETHKGDIFIITTSSSQKEFIYENNGDTLSPSRIFDIVTQKYFRNTLNVWFNLGFDAEVILKVLPKEELQELQVLNTVEWNNYRITYLPNKFLRIESGITPKDEQGRNFDNKVEYFDVAQLFQNNLKGAVNEWLPDNDLAKNEQDIDTTQFDNKDYILDNYDLITQYAKDDAKLTRLITKKLISVAEDIDIPCGKPFSTGYLAENYLKNRLEKKPGWHNSKMQSMAWKAFAGGRFEVFRRGNIGEVVGPDINSAYPAVMKDLPDPETLRWDYYADNEISISEIEKADYGFIEGTITTNKDKVIQPFAKKIDGIVKYPVLVDQDITVLKDTFLFALENGYIEDYNLDKVFLGFETDSTQYPFNFFPQKYKERKQWENEGKNRRAWLLKIILNSMFGKSAQTQYKKEILNEELDITTVSDGIEVNSGPLNEVPHKKWLECGSLFNPFLASYITGLTRLELHETVEEYDLVEDTILFATDSIMVEKEAYYNSDIQELVGNNDLSYEEQLGLWDFDYEGKAFVIGSGVYEVTLESGDIKMATRGFNESKSDIDSYRESAEKAGDNSIMIKHNRPYTLGEAVHQKKIDNTDIGVFFKGSRELKASFDSKREWDNPNCSWYDLLDGEEYSKPIVVSD